jgi:peptidoglycan hydrolase FlgJ
MVASADLSTKFALDVQAVNELRIASKKDSHASLEAAARQFEALFMNMMLKAMRDATPQDDLMDSEQSRLYTSMLDQQLSQSMASRGVGLADVMIRQLRGGLPPQPEQETPAPVSDVTGQRSAGDNPPLARLQSNPITQQRAQSSAPVAEPGLSGPSSALAPPTNPRAESFAPVAPQPGAHSHVMEFQARLMPYAQQASQATGIPALFMLGQAALESGWGKRELRGPDGTPSYNLFGVKAGANWKGPVVESVTTEYVGGVARKSVEKFRAYSSYADAFGDYANLLRSNPRYAQVLAQAVQGLDAESFAQGLQQAGYATDPNYADKLSQIIRTTQWFGEAPL